MFMLYILQQTQFIDVLLSQEKHKTIFMEKKKKIQFEVGDVSVCPQFRAKISHVCLSNFPQVSVLRKYHYLN